MRQTSTRPSSSSSNSTNARSSRRSHTMASFLAFIALVLARGEAFQSPLLPSTTTVTSTIAASSSSHQPHLSTQLSARRLNRRKSQTAAYYSSTADPPFSDKTTASSFGNRMRNLVLRQQQVEQEKHNSSSSLQNNKTGKRSRINPSKPSFVEEAVSLSTYKELVADEHERLVVVRFYATWCRACKAVEPHFYRLAHSMPDVKFVEVPVLEENANLHQGLGVPALPFAHIYSPTAGLVEELRMAKKDFKNFAKVVQTYREGQCSDLEVDPETGIFTSPFAAGSSRREDKGKQEEVRS